MSGFEYTAVNASNADRYRHWLALMGSERQSAAGVITLSSALPEESYPAQTGLAFRPEALIVTAHYPGNGVAASNYFFLGGAARGHQFGAKVFHPYLTTTQRSAWLSELQILPELADFNGFADDGFAFNVPNPLPFDLDVLYLALAGQGGYDCGVELSPSAPGLQSISGLGFTPGAVLFVTTQVTTLEIADASMARVMIGAADDANNQFSIWCGSLSGDVYTNQIAQGDKCIAMTRDANVFAPIPGVTDYHPVLQVTAELDSMDADGFTLNFTKVEGSIARQYAWMAFEDAAVGRWVYHHTSGQTGSVTTPYLPRGLVFFANDLAHESAETEYSPATNGSSIGFGVCDAALNQGVVSFQDVDAPPFRHPQTAGNRHSQAFGSFQRQSGGLAHDSARDRGTVTELVGEDFQPIVGMNWRYADRRAGLGFGRGLRGFDGVRDGV
jgi:hypothetical protein